MVTITFHGHTCFTLEADGRRVVVDPFLTGNPAADISADRLPKVDAVLLSHGHGDHLGDAVPIAQRDRAPMADPEDFKRQVGGRAQVVVLRPGQAHTLS